MKTRSSYLSPSPSYSSTRVLTSVTDPIEVDVVPLPAGVAGVLCITAAPGKYDPTGRRGFWKRDLKMDMARLREVHRIDTLVCLLETPEMARCKIPDLASRAYDVEIEPIMHPIVDGCAPHAHDDFRKAVADVASRLQDGQRVVVHCRGGMGRAGTFAACVLKHLDPTMTGDEAIRIVRKHRIGAVETLSQERYIRAFPALPSAPPPASSGFSWNAFDHDRLDPKPARAASTNPFSFAGAFGGERHSTVRTTGAARHALLRTVCRALQTAFLAGTPGLGFLVSLTLGKGTSSLDVLERGLDAATADLQAKAPVLAEALALASHVLTPSAIRDSGGRPSVDLLETARADIERALLEIAEEGERLATTPALKAPRGSVPVILQGEGGNLTPAMALHTTRGVTVTATGFKLFLGKKEDEHGWRLETDPVANVWRLFAPITDSE